MRWRPAARRTLLAAGLVAILAALTGCSDAAGDGTAPATCQPPSALVIVVSVHQNVAAPDIPADLTCDLAATIEAGRPIGIVAVDGTPSVLLPATRFPFTDANPAAHADDVTRAETSIIRIVKGARADSNGSDLLAAIAMAADVARTVTQTTDPARIVVVDSGLSDTGTLDLTRPGMIAAEPSEVARYLQAQKALPQLSGFSITLVGFGYTSLPQRPLNETMHVQVSDFWSAILHRAGATLTIHPVPRSGPGPAGVYTTKTVPVPVIEPPVPSPGHDFAFVDGSVITFLPDSTRLRDHDAAAHALRPIADWLLHGTTRHAHIIGTTSSAGTSRGRHSLSTQRADQIRTLLHTMGVPAGRVDITGRGYTADPPDRLANGTLDPAKAALNRAVHIILSDPAAQRDKEAGAR